MAQTAQAEATVAIVIARQTEPPPGEALDPTAGFANPTTLLLLIVGAGFLWWNMRRRRMFEERLREQRREEAVTHAEQSAQNVALIMRERASPEAAAAAATQGLASAAPAPAGDRSIDRARQATEDLASEANGTETAAHPEAHGRMLERAEAAALAEQAAAEEAQRAAKAAEAASAAASAPAPASASRSAAEQESRDALLAGLRDLEREDDAPLGAIPGDGTAICPPDHPIKGVAAPRVYHGPGKPGYPATVADYCFASMEAAEAAGYRQAPSGG